MFIYTCLYSIEIWWVPMMCQILWLSNEDLDFPVLLNLGGNLKILPFNLSRQVVEAFPSITPLSFLVIWRPLTKSWCFQVAWVLEWWGWEYLVELRKIFKHRCMWNIKEVICSQLLMCAFSPEPRDPTVSP